MKKQHSVTIAIPAFNEASNIKQIIEKLLLQKEVGFHMQKIVVLSDGSTDKTNILVRSIKDSRVVLHTDKNRLGKSARLDQFFQTVKSDIVVLVDADIVIKDNVLFSKIFTSTDLSKAGVVGINALPLPAKKYFEKIVEVGVMVMKGIAKRWRDGNNYLSFKGCFLALDGKFAKSIRMPSSVINNDAFLYFAAREKGYTPVYLETCFVYYRSPMVLADQIKQSSRHQGSRQELEKFFNLDWKKEYTPPLTAIFSSVLHTFIRKPIPFVAYVGVLFLAKMQKQKKVTSVWSIAGSTKQEIASN